MKLEQETKLEDTRSGHHVGDIRYRLDDEELRPLLFHDYAVAATALTAQALDRFQMLSSIGANPYVIPGILTWFFTAESLISTVRKVLEDRAARDGEGPLTESKRVQDKLEAIGTRLGVDPTKAKPLLNRFGDLATVRNRLGHDLTGENDAPFRHSAFVGEVSSANEIDLLEACAISLSICDHLRAPFAGADLMPSVAFAGRFVKADVVAEQVFFPTFQRIVEMKGLATDFSPQIDRVPLGTQLLIPFELLIAHAGPMAPREIDCEPSIFEVQAAEFREALPPTADDKFQIPNYVRPEHWDAAVEAPLR